MENIGNCLGDEKQPLFLSVQSCGEVNDLVDVIFSLGTFFTGGGMGEKVMLRSEVDVVVQPTELLSARKGGGVTEADCDRAERVSEE